MKVTTEVQKMVNTKILECRNKAEAHYQRAFPICEAVYDVRGRWSGYVHAEQCVRSGNWVMHLNPVLLMENIDDFIARTVPHELAHIIDCEVNKGFSRTWSGKRSVHGPSWKAVMRVLGIRDASRCHSYDTTNAQVRKKASFEYKCACGQSVFLGPVRHARHQERVSSGLPGYTHRCSRSSVLTYVGGDVVASKKPVVAKFATTGKPTPAPKAKTGSKADLALLIVKLNSSRSRSELIAMLQSQLNMSTAGASTYYYNAKKALGM